MKPFEAGDYLVRLLDKNNKEELRLVQKLRFDYLLKDFDPSLPEEGLDDDGFDEYCDSILVIDKKNGAIALRPGLSGYAQIHKRGDLDPETKAMYDGVYLEHFSLWWDTKIFVYTILKVFGAAKGR